MLAYDFVPTDWGYFGYVARAGALVATLLPAPRKEAETAIRSRYPQAVPAKNLLPDFRRQIARYFQGKPTEFTVAVDLADCPPFHQRALEACRRIPYGRITTYADLARASGNAKAVRAAGAAMARNPLPIVIPCHRVLRSDGTLGGFSSKRGVAEKLALLQMEIPALCAPHEHDGKCSCSKASPCRAKRQRNMETCA
ncbi:MAG: methylated-DNA--[protein]-cysteine S-methyltransferase [Planctomycetota bacterium]